MYRYNSCRNVGIAVGVAVGVTVGVTVGVAVGTAVGFGVGTCALAAQENHPRLQKLFLL